MSKKYIVIKADIINSRQSKNRNEMQQKLSKALDEINSEFTKSIASNFIFTSGDGFQGLMKRGVHIFVIMQKLEAAVMPLKIRYGLGIGEVSTDIDVENSAVIDGSSYHYADAMLSEVEKLEGQFSSYATNILIQSDTDYDELLNALFSLRYVVRASWKDRQREVIATFIKMNEKQYDTAAALNVNQSTVSRALKGADYYSIKAAEQRIVEFIEGKML